MIKIFEGVRLDKDNKFIIDHANNENSDTTHRYLFESIKQVPTDMLKFENLKCKSILILEDINTSGATINEILEIINELNSNCDVYIYTLIGTENYNSLDFSGFK